MALGPNDTAERSSPSAEGGVKRKCRPISPSIAKIVPKTEIEECALALMILSRDKFSSQSKSILEPEARSGSETVTRLNIAFVSDEQVYSCSICGKSFNSYQGLGGHMTIHKKPALGDDVASSAKEERVHQCKICHKIFSRGQELGGHMRAHRPLNRAPKSDLKVKFKLNLDLKLNLEVSEPMPQEVVREVKEPVPKEEVGEVEASPEIKKQRLSNDGLD